MLQLTYCSQFSRSGNCANLKEDLYIEGEGGGGLISIRGSYNRNIFVLASTLILSLMGREEGIVTGEALKRVFTFYGISSVHHFIFI